MSGRPAGRSFAGGSWPTSSRWQSVVAPDGPGGNGVGDDGGTPGGNPVGLPSGGADPSTGTPPSNPNRGLMTIPPSPKDTSTRSQPPSSHAAAINVGTPR